MLQLLAPWSTAGAVLLIAVAALIDLRTRRIPNALALAALALALIAAADRGDALAGAALAAGPLFLLACWRPAAMGMGDVKLALAAGALVGTAGLSSLALGSALIGALIAVIVAARRGPGATFAYGPAIALAVLVALL